MSVSDEVSREVDGKTLTLLTTLERTRSELELSKKAWSDYLQITESEYERVLLRREDLSALALYRVSEQLRLNPTAFENGNIDYSALIQAQKGNRTYINPRFTLAAHSKKFTVINTLNFIEKHRGTHLRTAVNRHFQICDDFWKNDFDGPINIRFITELWTFLKGRGLSESDFRFIGLHSSTTLQGTEIGKKLGSMDSVQDVYEILFSEVIFKFERNCHYSVVRLDASQCVVEARSNREITEALEVPYLGTSETCHVKTGMLAGMPSFMGNECASVHETHCEHRGDSRCRFVIDFAEPRFKNGTGRRLTLLS